MKKTLFFLLIITLCICLFLGCAEKMPLTVDESVKSVAVTSLPEGYEHSFSGEDAVAVADYLSSLTLISVFPEDPDKYGGMTWVITLEYGNGQKETLYHFGNMFIRREGGEWFKMNFDEASRFDALLEELSEDETDARVDRDDPPQPGDTVH